MAGRISIDNLSNSLKDIIEQNGLTEEQVIELIKNNTGDISQLNTSNKSSLVAAINELFQSANNGKELIANAIGEPVSSNDTFSAMSNDINGLLATFKTNMMNNGVTVESGDKFKALIDKIATLADSEGKGIQIASGHFSVDVLQEASETEYMEKNRLVFDQPLNFTPDRIILSIPALQLQSLNTYAQYTIDSDIHRSLSHRFDIYDEHGNNIIMYIGTVINHFTSEGLYLYAAKYTSDYALRAPEGIDWLAIGVGEEDTTLRDSLASILTEEGVDVTEEDDMASLIGKVDEEFDNKNAKSGLDIISATELPATGKENQICVITDNPVDNFLLTSNLNDVDVEDTNTIYIPNIPDDQSKLVVVGEEIKTNYYFNSIVQGEDRLESFIYKNGSWEQLTINLMYFIEAGLQRHPEFFVMPSSSGGWSFTTKAPGGLMAHTGSSNYPSKLLILSNDIDFSRFTKMRVSACHTSSAQSFGIYIGISNGSEAPTNTYSSSDINIDSVASPSVVYSAHPSPTIVTQEFDISSWTKTGKLVILARYYTSNVNLMIHELVLY